MINANSWIVYDHIGKQYKNIPFLQKEQFLYCHVTIYSIIIYQQCFMNSNKHLLNMAPLSAVFDLLLTAEDIFWVKIADFLFHFQFC